ADVFFVRRIFFLRAISGADAPADQDAAADRAERRAARRRQRRIFDRRAVAAARSDGGLGRGELRARAQALSLGVTRATAFLSGVKTGAPRRKCSGNFPARIIDKLARKSATTELHRSASTLTERSPPAPTRIAPSSASRETI